MERGVDCVGCTIRDDGVPIFAFMCDCGVITSIVIEDLVQNNTLEFAYTCDCMAIHWIMIGKEVVL